MSPSSFRALIFVSLALSIATAILGYLAQSKLPTELMSQIDILYEKHDFWKMLVSLGAMLLSLALGLVSYYGLFFFRKWAPSLAISSTLLAGIAITFLPPIVSPGFIETLSMYGVMLWGALIAYAKSEWFVAESMRRAKA